MSAARTAVTLVIVLAFSSCTATLVPYGRAELAPIAEITGEAHWPVAQAVDRAADSFIEQSGVPGVQVALRYGNEFFAAAYGHRENRRGEFSRVDDLYRVGSITKIYTAAVVLALVEQGRLGLDDGIAGWVDLPGANAVTVRHLLNHTSGIPDYTELAMPNFGTTLRPRRWWRPEQLVARVRRRDLHFAPGSQYRYSNTNYVALGMIVESVTGRPVAELYRALLLGPARLDDTWFLPYEADLAAPSINGRLTTGYERDIIRFGTQPMTPAKTNWATYAYSAGAMVSTAIDLVDFADALFAGVLIGPQSVRAMTTFVDAPDEDIPAQTGYGLGLRRLEIDGSILMGHTGTIPGFGALVMHAPAADFTVAIVGNLSLLDPVSLLEDILGELRGVPEWRRR